MLSAVVAAKVSFPLNLLRGRKHKGKKERTKLQKNPAEREAPGPLGEVDEDEWRKKR